jgi:hypothetical protein
MSRRCNLHPGVRFKQLRDYGGEIMDFRVRGESSSERAASIERVIRTVSTESDDVKKEALVQLSPPVPSPTRRAADVIWVILVSGLVVILVLAILGLTHVIGHGVTDDKVITIFTTSLAGLLGLFIQGPS